MKTNIILDFDAPNPEQGRTNIAPAIYGVETLLKQLDADYDAACDDWAYANKWYDEVETPTEADDERYWAIVNHAHRIEEQIESLRKVLSNLNSLEYAMYELSLTME